MAGRLRKSEHVHESYRIDPRICQAHDQLVPSQPQMTLPYAQVLILTEQAPPDAG